MNTNCMFCLEPVGVDDLAIPLLPCQCRTPHHDSCRATWNGMNPYRCPICRKTFKPELAVAPRPVIPQRYQEHTYVAMPSAPPAVSVSPPQATTQHQQQQQINVKKVFIILAAVLVGVMFILLMKNLWA